MTKLLELVGEQTEFLLGKGYISEDLGIPGIPDGMYQSLHSHVSKGILKTWPENKPFEFSFDKVGHYDSLGGAACFKFYFQYIPGSYSIRLTKLNVRFYKKSIDVDISSPQDLPHSSEIPQLLSRPVVLRRKYNIQTRTKYGAFTPGPYQLKK